ncbi:MAG: hypothetical protein HC844_03850 [Tabrizicola sp.]|nr:hypothetical protein [Tabrizicola sp.]
MPITLETHTRLAKAQIRKLVQRILPMGADTACLKVEILTGMHAGTSGEIEGAAFSIGSVTSNDLMLLDDEALGDQANFSIEGSIFGPLISVTTTRKDLKINGTSLRPGQSSAPEPLPCEMDFNGIRLRFSSAAGSARPLAHQAEKAAMPLLVTIALIAFATQIYLSNRPETPLVLHATPAPDPVKKLAAAASAEDDVKGMITEAGLSEHLTVEKSGPAAISISGTLPAGMTTKWHDIRGEIDKQAGAAVIVNRVSEAPPLTDMPPIAAVRLGEDAAVILADGKTLSAGDKINGDWTIRSVREDSIEIERDGEAVVVTY